MKYVSTGQQWILFALSFFILGILCYKFYIPTQFAPPGETRNEFVIEVLGDVPRPCIHVFQNPPTVMEAIHAAGFPEVVLSSLESPASLLETGTSLTVTRSSLGHLRIQYGRMEAKKLLAFSIPLDLNSVSASDLCLIPGIGAALAQEIVACRERKGRFRSLEELADIKGIGDKKQHSFKAYLVIAQP